MVAFLGASTARFGLASMHPLTAFIEGDTAAALKPAQCVLHCFDLFHQSIQFRKFALRESLPAPGGRSAVTKTKKELANFLQSKTGLPGCQYDCEPLQDGCVVTSLAADSLWGCEYSNLLVITNGRRTDACLSRHFRN